MLWLWYTLTAYIPRRLPVTPAEYARFKHIMLRFYGVPDEHRAWILVSSFITSTPAHRLRRAWGDIANAAKRLEINDLAKEQGDESRQALRLRLTEATAKQIQYAESVKRHLDMTPDGALAVLEDRPSVVENIANDLCLEHPDVASIDEWKGYVKQIALEENTKTATERAHDKEGEEQPSANGRAQQAPSSPPSS